MIYNILHFFLSRYFYIYLFQTTVLLTVVFIISINIYIYACKLEPKFTPTCVINEYYTNRSFCKLNFKN